MRKLRVALVVSTVLLGSSAVPWAGAQEAPPTTAPADQRPLLSVRPALLGQTTLDQGHYRYDVPAGTAIDDAIEVINGRDEPLEVTLYGADLIQAQGGGIAPRQRDEEQLETGDWITVDDETVTLGPQGSATIPFHITVPEGSVPGDYPGAVVASVIAGRSPGGIAIETRAALTVDIRVPGSIDLQPVLGGLDHRRVGDTEAFDVDLQNEGNVLFTAIGRVEILDGGDVVATVPLSPSEIYVIPGGEASFAGAWDDLPFLGRRTARAVFDIEVRNEPADPVSSNELSLWFLPIPVIAGLLAAIVLAVLAWWRSRGWRSSRKELRQEAKRILEDRTRQDQERTPEPV